MLMINAFIGKGLTTAEGIHPYIYMHVRTYRVCLFLSYQSPLCDCPVSVEREEQRQLGLGERTLK